MRIYRRSPSFICALAACTFAAAALIACSAVPITDRNQLNLVPESQLREMSEQQHQQFLQENKISSDKARTATVQAVGRKIATAIETHMRETGDAERVDGLNWSFSLVESPEHNAFAMPGGKVVVFEGMMELIGNDDSQLATVMGHEIAHVIANHGNERMSQQLLTQYGGVALGALTSQQSEQVRGLFNTAYGVGTQVGVLLPFSRTQELEADKLGLIFMAKAGYDPRTAVGFWEKMQSQGEGGSPPQFLSTHPAHSNRIDSIEKYLPEAMQYYK